MPWQRFRDFDAAREALWVDRDDPELVPRIRRLWAFARRLAPGAQPRGLRKFRTIEEANEARDAWEALRVRTLRAGRAVE
jgi:hypothetical protein